MIETLLPEEATTCSLTEEVDPSELYPEEAICIASAVPKRRREFAQGRLCARRALAALGIARFPLLSGKDRAPIWPEGVVGSLTHCGGYCAVAVARREEIPGLGIDVEAAEPLGQELVPLVCVAAELARLERSPESSRGLTAKLLFSVKESVFKCVYPITGVFLDFQDCEVMLDERSGTFTAQMRNPSLPNPWRGTALHGRFATDAGRLFTAIALRVR